jgi:hypothetical protein
MTLSILLGLGVLTSSYFPLANLPKTPRGSFTPEVAGKNNSPISRLSFALCIKRFSKIKLDKPKE